MKNTFQTRILALLSLFFLPNLLFGQLCEVSLNEKIQKSSLIVEGRVVESKCYRADDETIYTAHKIKVSALLKGEYREGFLTVTTWGGELDGEKQTWTHLLTLEIGDYGIFFLEPTRVKSIEDSNFQEFFDVYSGVQGFLAFAQNDAKAWVAYEPFHIYLDIENDIYGRIARTTGQGIINVNKDSNVPRSGVRYHFTDIGFDGTSVTFNVYVNSLVGTKKLYNSGIQIGYNSAFFGANLATNGNLVLQEDGISQSSTYDLTQSNTTSSKVKIELMPIGVLTGLSTIGATEQLLAKGTITVQNLLADPGITYDITEMQSMSKFYESGTAQLFDTVIVEGDWRLFENLLPTISDFYPDTTIAGIKNQISIVGTGFGSSSLPPVNRKVIFTNVSQPNSPPGQQWMSPLPGDYLLWSDTLIVVNVPSVGNNFFSGSSLDNHAGTGKIGVVTSLGIDTSYTKILYVRATAFNSATINPIGQFHGIGHKFVDKNLDGGYDLYFSSQFANLNLGEGTEAFKRALITWRCTTGINFRIKQFSDIPPAQQPFSCRIGYGPLPSGTLSTSTAITFDSILFCANSSGIARHGVVHLFNMTFNNIYSWHTGVDMPVLNWANTIDLETTALHELGHAHELGHSNNKHNVMWYLVNQYRRGLTVDDVKGGQYIVFFSSVDTSFKCESPMQSVLGSDCGVVPIVDIKKVDSSVKMFPNPVSGNASIVFPPEFNNLKIRIVLIDQLGRVIKDDFDSISTEILAIDLRQCEPGLYYLLLDIEGQNTNIIKFVKQQ